jgi:hypothetical protein
MMDDVETRKPMNRRLRIIFTLLITGLLAVVGLTRIFAAQVAYQLTPASQTAVPGQAKAVSVSLITGGQTVNGGSVKIVYDQTQLSFVRFDKLASADFSFSGQVTSANSYSFSYQYNHPQGTTTNTPLASLVFAIKPVSSTQTAAITITESGTSAYAGPGKKPTTYQVSRSNATITIQGTSSATPATTSPGGPPPAGSTPSSSGSTTSEETPLTGEGSEVSGAPLAVDSERSTLMPAKKSIMPLVVIGILLVLLVGAAVYAKGRARLGALLRGGLSRKPAKPPTAHTEPPVVKVTPPVVTSLPPKPAVTVTSPPAQSETVPPVTPTSAIQPAPKPPIPPPSPKPAVKPPAAVSPVPPVPPLVTVATPQKLRRKKADDIPDMFELAQEHPESFGSATLFEEEEKQQEPPA